MYYPPHHASLGSVSLNDLPDLLMAARVGEIVRLQAQDIAADRITYQARNTKTKQTLSVIMARLSAELLGVVALPQQVCSLVGRNRATSALRPWIRRLWLACDCLGFEG